MLRVIKIGKDCKTGKTLYFKFKDKQEYLEYKAILKNELLKSKQNKVNIPVWLQDIYGKK